MGTSGAAGLEHIVRSGEALKFDDLVRETGVTARQIRYLISEGFVPPPTGGRANARYGEQHVTAIRRYDRLRSLGFPPAAIRLLLDAREGIPVLVLPGLTLVVAPDLIGSGLDPRRAGALAAERLAELFATHAGEDSDAPHSAR